MKQKKKEEGRANAPTQRNRPEAVPPDAPSWVTPELIEQTLETWQPYYPHPLTETDALAIILNISRYWNAVREWDRK